jgi:hypothetical protein
MPKKLGVELNGRAKLARHLKSYATGPPPSSHSTHFSVELLTPSLVSHALGIMLRHLQTVYDTP